MYYMYYLNIVIMMGTEINFVVVVVVGVNDHKKFDGTFLGFLIGILIYCQ